MSIRENIQIFHSLDADAYLTILIQEYGAKPHPQQPASYLIDEPPLPFYRPEQIEDHFSILSFSNALLSGLLIQALVDHPELAPDSVRVVWTQEQELIMEKSLGELRKQMKKDVTKSIK